MNRSVSWPKTDNSLTVVEDMVVEIKTRCFTSEQSS